MEEDFSSIPKEQFDISVGELDLRPSHNFDIDTPLPEVLETMSSKNWGMVLITKNEEFYGVLTERDILYKVMTPLGVPDGTKISDVVSRYPFMLDPQDSLKKAMNIMNIYKIIHLPVKGDPYKILSIKSVFEYLSEVFQKTLQDLGMIPHWRGPLIEVYKEKTIENMHSLEGMVSGAIFRYPMKRILRRRPHLLPNECSIQEVIAKMQAVASNVILLMSYKTKITGIITERDILTKVVSKIDLTSPIPSQDIASLDPHTLGLTHAMGIGLNQMNHFKYRNVPIVNQDFQPLSVLSMQDILSYFYKFL